ncbi:hypothetical protein PROVRUST_08301 [Providencia rustigianii DSM 4541]|uniref:Uncharacterized protein n=1 Tax=Providencia rustigianii DSM 4541 TaxID=500637 RepID=D1P7S8_9GAMM|nr:hypothetical protein PROVRUST_08301 [Providencia rustigianii DSM 4541]
MTLLTHAIEIYATIILAIWRSSTWISFNFLCEIRSSVNGCVGCFFLYNHASMLIYFKVYPYSK